MPLLSTKTVGANTLWVAKLNYITYNHYNNVTIRSSPSLVLESLLQINIPRLVGRLNKVVLCHECELFDKLYDSDCQYLRRVGRVSVN
jgi:hypothetical protein